MSWIQQLRKDDSDENLPDQIRGIKRKAKETSAANQRTVQQNGQSQRSWNLNGNKRKNINRGVASRRPEVWIVQQVGVIGSSGKANIARADGVAKTEIQAAEQRIQKKNSKKQNEWRDEQIRREAMLEAPEFRWRYPPARNHGDVVTPTASIPKLPLQLWRLNSRTAQNLRCAMMRFNALFKNLLAFTILLVAT